MIINENCVPGKHNALIFRYGKLFDFFTWIFFFEKGYYCCIMDFITAILILYSSILLFVQRVSYNWSVGMESAVDSSFFWGYLVTQIPGGFLASAFPANRIFGTAIACSAFLNLLVPGAIAIHPTVVVLVRAMQGFVEVITDEIEIFFPIWQT